MGILVSMRRFPIDAGRVIVMDEDVQEGEGSVRFRVFDGVD